MDTLGKKVAQLRAARGWTLQQLSDASNVSTSHLSAMEKGLRKSPSFQLMAQIADAFDVPLAYFRDDADSTDHSALGQQIHQFYDAETAQFIASEQAKPYVALARTLAQRGGQDPTMDAPAILQVIAQFMRDRQASYKVP